MRLVELIGYDANVEHVDGGKILVLTARDATEQLRFGIADDGAKQIARMLLGIETHALLPTNGKDRP